MQVITAKKKSFNAIFKAGAKGREKKRERKRHTTQLVIVPSMQFTMHH